MKTLINENTNYLQRNELNKELDSLRNKLKSKNEIISTLMKETCVERGVVISKNNTHKNVLVNDILCGISNKNRVKSIISNIEGDLKITVNSDDADIHVNNEVEKNNEVENNFIQAAKKSKPTNGSRSISIVGDYHK